MYAPLAMLLLSSALAQEPTTRAVTLALPHALREGETATLVVTVGVIPRGARIEVTTSTGRPLGSISPYGIRAGRAAGTYAIPLPADAIVGKRVTVLLSLHHRGTQRPPTKKEVTKVRVSAAAAANAECRMQNVEVRTGA